MPNPTSPSATVASPPPRRDGVAWSNVASLGSIHIAAVVGLFYVFWRPSLPTLVLTAVLYLLCGLSITAGYHRLFAHRTYRVRAPVRWGFLLFGAATFQNSAAAWSVDHRAHHADTDGPGDPHPITKGFWYAHAGWLLRPRANSGRVTELTDLWELRSIRLQHRFYPFVAVGVGLVLPTAIASLWGDPWGGLLVAGTLRAAVMLQATFCVNSVAHWIGKKPYDAVSSARDSVVTAILTLGEGYHNFHHRFPFDYRNGIRWWQYDPSKWLITVMSKVGLATKLRAASPATIAKARAGARARLQPTSLAA